MRFSRVVIGSLAVELPDEAWPSALIEQKLAPCYERLRLPAGRLELFTGIRERRFWSRPTRPSTAAAAAGRKALAQAGVAAGELDLLIHAGVCRDRLEPSTAAYVHGLLGASPAAQILDVSNACLGFLNALVLAAGLIESGQIRHALVCSGEDGRSLVERTIATLNAGAFDGSLNRETIKPYFANLTIGAGAAAAVICHEDCVPTPPVANALPPMRLLAATALTDSAANTLCEGDSAGGGVAGAATGGGNAAGAVGGLVMQTDSEALLGAGVALAEKLWARFRAETGWDAATPRRVITHQVGRRHSQLLFERLGLDPAKDFRSFEFLGNVGSVSLPATLAFAREPAAAGGAINAGTPALAAGDAAALLGIGSGLAAMFLAIRC
ncbi:MAG: 3-oxoacyl-ACP synthase III [Puniceicoccales bacterium]|jgi:3-oxoacyl-[acyl-carrier-protein] synthase-3|nr:3-oxoacyl-ACP synthase III [Puniceicoccales bacterium]